MKKYKDISGNSGVLAYESGADFIRVWFRDRVKPYLYDYRSAGRENVETMKSLAAKGKKLSTYIARYVKDRYVRQ